MKQRKMDVDKNSFISYVIAVGCTGLISSFAGFRIEIVGSVLISIVLFKVVTGAIFNRVVDQAIDVTWRFWVWVAAYIIAPILGFAVAATGSNIFAWFELATFLVGFIFNVLDFKKINAIVDADELCCNCMAEEDDEDYVEITEIPEDDEEDYIEDEEEESEDTSEDEEVDYVVASTMTAKEAKMAEEVAQAESAEG